MDYEGVVSRPSLIFVALATAPGSLSTPAGSEWQKTTTAALGD